jgi:hypothetical protein
MFTYKEGILSEQGIQSLAELVLMKVLEGKDASNISPD